MSSSDPPEMDTDNASVSNDGPLADPSSAMPPSSSAAPLRAPSASTMPLPAKPPSEATPSDGHVLPARPSSPQSMDEDTHTTTNRPFELYHDGADSEDPATLPRPMRADDIFDLGPRSARVEIDRQMIRAARAKLRKELHVDPHSLGKKKRQNKKKKRSEGKGKAQAVDGVAPTAQSTLGSSAMEIEEGENGNVAPETADDDAVARMLRSTSAPRTPKPKQTAVSSASTSVTPTSDSVPPTLSTMPFEMISWIVYYLRPPDLLALTRTSKFFRHTLISTDAIPLWRRARANCIPSPLPDPNAEEIPKFASARRATAPIWPELLFMLGMDGVQVAEAGVPLPAPAPAPDAGADGAQQASGAGAEGQNQPTQTPEELARLERFKQDFPAKQWNEWEFASVIFDPGPCHMCGNETTLPFYSYDLRYRRCAREQCRDKLDGLVLVPSYSPNAFNSSPSPLTGDSAVNRLIMSALPHSGNADVTARNATRYYVAQDLRREVERHNPRASAEERIALKEEWEYRAIDVKRQHDLMRFASEWQKEYSGKRSSVKGANEEEWRKMAKTWKLPTQDMINSATLRTLFADSMWHQKAITPAEWQAAKAAITEETQILTVNRHRRESTKAQVVTRVQIDAFHKFLLMQARAARGITSPGAPDEEMPSVPGAINPGDSSTSGPWFDQNETPLPLVPPFREFAELSIIKLLVTRTGLAKDVNIPESLFDPKGAIAKLIRSELKEWSDEIKLTLGALLSAGPPQATSGYSSLPHSHSMPTTTGHTSSLADTAKDRDKTLRDKRRRQLTERFSSLFLCRLCSAQAPEFTPYAQGERIWRALTLPEVLAHECRGAWTRNGIEWHVSHFAPDWRGIAALKEVLSKAGIDEERESMENVRVKLRELERRIRCETCVGRNIMVPLSDVVRHARRHETFQCTITSHAQTGILKDVAKPLMRGSGQHIHDKSSEKKYGCKHCERFTKPYSFNGIRSHLSAKHKIEVVGDEDFYVHSGRKTERPGRVVSVSGEGSRGSRGRNAR